MTAIAMPRSSHSVIVRFAAVAIFEANTVQPEAKGVEVVNQYASLSFCEEAWS